MKNAFDPAQNQAADTKLLKQLLTKYNSGVGLALAATTLAPGDWTATREYRDYGNAELRAGDKIQAAQQVGELRLKFAAA